VALALKPAQVQVQMRVRVRAQRLARALEQAPVASELARDLAAQTPAAAGQRVLAARAQPHWVVRWMVRVVALRAQRGVFFGRTRTFVHL
jgi:hypothetical protein